MIRHNMWQYDLVFYVHRTSAVMYMIAQRLCSFNPTNTQNHVLVETHSQIKRSVIENKKDWDSQKSVNLV